MKISRLLLGAILVCSAPALSQPEILPPNGLQYPAITFEEAIALGQINPIKLHLTDSTVEAALEEVERQSGVSINTNLYDENTSIRRILDAKLSLDFETYSFQDAARTIFSKAGVKAQLSSYNGQAPWEITNGVPNEAGSPSSGKGPFQIRAIQISSSSTKSVTLGLTDQRNNYDNFSVQLSMRVEPQIPLVSIAKFKVTRADDDKGHSLLMPERDNPFWSSFGNNTTIPLLSPAATSRSIAHLEGKFVCLLASQYETWEVPDLLNSPNANHTFNAGQQQVRVTIKSAEQQGNSLRLDVESLSRTGQNTGMNPEINPLLNISRFSSLVQVMDGNGQLLRGGGGGGHGGGSEARMQMTFFPPSQERPRVEMGKKEEPAPPTLVGPFKFIIKAPTKIVQTDIPFSFSDLPLP